MTESARVTVDIYGAVAHVRLNRPEKLNALDIDMFRALVATGRRLISTEDIRAVVISGNGRAFCAGLDFSQFARISKGAGQGAEILVTNDERIGGARALGQQAVRVWSQVPVPVIAAIHGVAFGGGLQIALGADIRITSQTAQLSVMEIQWGLVPDMAGTQLLPGLVGRDVAKELTFTGRRVGGAEATRIGLATRMAEDPVASAIELANEIATHSGNALRHAKSLLDMADRVPIQQGLDAEQNAINELIAESAVAAIVHKRLSTVREGNKDD